MHYSSDSPRPGRFALVAGGVAVGVVAAGWALTTVLRASLTVLRPGRTSIDELVTASSSAVALGLLLWVSAGLLVSVLGTLPGRVGGLAGRVRDRVAPAAVRRCAGILLGVTIAGSLAPGAAATETAAAAAVASAAPAPSWTVAPAAALASAAVPEPAPEPEWTPAPVRPQPPVSLTAQRTEVADEAPAEVVVRRGDTLWDLAAAHLTPEATDSEIAAAWQRWYAENRSVIGADPDLILPGQVLTVPGSGS